MKMKRIMCFATASALAAAMLSGCSAASGTSSAESTSAATESTTAESTAASTEAAVDYSNVTVQDILDANNVADLVAKYGSVTMYSESSDGDSAGANSTFYFHTNDAGELQMLGCISQADDSEQDINIAATSTDTGSGIYYYDESGASMQVVEPESLTTAISNYYVSIDTEQTLVDASLQDDALVVYTKDSYGDENNYAENYYYCDPDTLELYSISYVYHYDFSDGSSSDISDAMKGETDIFYSFLYGENEDAASLKDASEECLTDENPCVLTVVVKPGSDDSAEYTFNLKKGVTINAVGQDSIYNLYYDEACTQSVDTVNTNADAVTIYAAE